MMKKVFSIFSLALMLVCCNFVFTSCGDDDDDDDDDEEENENSGGNNNSNNRHIDNKEQTFEYK